MKIYEVTSAEDQLDLLKKIIDNTWSAIEQQAVEQQKAEAERQAWSNHAKPVKTPKTKTASLPIQKPKAVTPIADKQSTDLQNQRPSRPGTATSPTIAVPPTPTVSQAPSNIATTRKPSTPGTKPITVGSQPLQAPSPAVKPTVQPPYKPQVQADVKLQPELKARYGGVRWVPKKA